MWPLFSETSTDMPVDLVLFNMPLGPLEIKEKIYLTDAPPWDMPTNSVKLYQRKLLHCQYNIHAM